MGTISSSVGLISGLDIESLVGQLIAIEARPRDQLSQRIELLTQQQTALLSIQARTLAIKLAAVNFNEESVFEQKTATSSNEEVLTVSPTRFSTHGTFNFMVKRLASNHQLISRGYASSTSGIGAGTVSFEMGQGQLGRATDLSMINGQLGFDRGGLEITDRSGAVSQIDISAALTMTDIIEAINNDRTVNVTARVSGDHLIIEDQSGGLGNLTILGASAESLGIATDANGVAAGSVTGSDLLSVTGETRLSDLNDGNGVRMGLLDDLNFTRADGQELAVDLKGTMFEVTGASDQSTRLAALNSGGGVRLGTIRITDRNKKTVDIDLTTLGPNATMAQLRDLIDQETIAAGMVDGDGASTIKMLFNASDHVTMTDSSVGGDERRSDFIIEDLDGGFAAEDLGIADSINGSTISGEQVYRMETLGDVINAINNHYNNDGQLVVSINAAGTGLSVQDLTGGTALLVINSTNGTADDLGITTDGSDGVVDGRRLIAGLNTVMLRNLNGGHAGDPLMQIANGGSLSFSDGDGNNAALDLTSVFTVQDVLDAINGAGTNITAELNAVGNGIVLNDISTGGGNLTISGDLADKLGLTIDAAVTEVNSGNLQLQYITEASRLEDLRQGLGVKEGEFEITNSLGQSVTINIFNDKTLGDVIDTINVQQETYGIEAKINATGDGLVIIDLNAGPERMKIEEVDGGSTAKELGILGTADSVTNQIDGSFEFKLEIGGGDNLEDIVSRVNEAGLGITASIIDDGSQFRLSFASEVSGSAGVLYVDGGTTSLATSTLNQGQDALLLNNSLLVRSSSNSVQNVIKGATLDLHSVSDQPVEITIEQDVDGVVAQVQNFVDAYNSAMDEIDNLTRFDPETLERGLLFADSTVSQIKRNLQSMVQRAVPGLPSGLNRLVQIGVNFAPPGTETNADGEVVAIARTPRLQLDETELREVLAADPEGVKAMFTKEDNGLGDYIGTQLDALAGQSEGTIKNRVDAINRQQDLFKDRIEHLDDLLSRKENRLYQQFYAMEQALASLQSQQSALASLSALAASSRTTSN